MPGRPSAVELDDIQGLLRFGYKHHSEACLVLLRITNRAAARAWLARAPVLNAVDRAAPPDTVLQVAFTSHGLRALGLADDVVDGFSREFVDGMSGNDNRERRLGDIGANAPRHWRWGGQGPLPEVLLLLYAKPGLLAGWRAALEAQYAPGLEPLASLSCAELRGVEPFGFVDGISQPQPDWEGRRRVRDEQRLSYTNLTCLGEFMLGYPNEYGSYTDRPLLDPARPAACLLPRAKDAPGLADLGRNGSYLVLRQLRQDAAAFWRFLDSASGGNPDQRVKLAEKMVGRTQRGEPLAGADAAPMSGHDAAPKADLNNFTYRNDPHGLRCPLGAHIRRVNPRNADLPPGAPGPLSWLRRTLGFDRAALAQDLVSSTRFHRLLRRGREYGAPPAPSQALAAGRDAGEQGLYFICLNANIARQFEFVQGAWVANPRFDGLNDSDPLLGVRLPALDGSATDAFSIPQADGPDQRLAGLPQFVTVVGGAYFFLPGIRALRYLAAAT
jgi:deferrochelatase/peroxidase EfeB